MLLCRFDEKEMKNGKQWQIKKEHLPKCVWLCGRAGRRAGGQASRWAGRWEGRCVCVSACGCDELFGGNISYGCEKVPAQTHSLLQRQTQYQQVLFMVPLLQEV